ncbi:MAG: ferrous iron transporter B [Clostridia bacterium]|nr:ferrous iron transporter B [Clostridia bacterium]
MGLTNERHERVIALVGNPNVGKSTVFNSLTGLHQHTGNWPGKTVSGAEGRCRSGETVYRLVDTPGTYSLLARSAEEEVTREYLLHGEAEVALVVCDAACLSRNLLLLLQVMAIVPRVVVCVNLLDEAARRSIYPDLAGLEALLGVPVVGTVARKKKSAAALLAALDRVIDAPPPVPPAFLSPLLERCRLSLREGKEQEAASAALAARAEEIGHAVTRGEGEPYSRRDRRLDRFLTGRRSAYPIMLLLLLLVLFITIVGANYPSALLADGFSWLGNLFRTCLSALEAPPWLIGLLVDGVWRVLSQVVAVMLPPMAIFFPLFTLLEDSGYLPRIAYNLDRPFCACHACGKQALTMCMGFGCNAAGVVGCRIIDSPRERLLAVLTNSLVPCNGRFPALLALISMFLVGAAGGFAASLLSACLLTLFILLGVGMTFLATRLLSATVLRGLPSSFVLEMPPFRRPQIGRVILRSLLDRTMYVLGRAAAVAVPAGCLIWLMANVTVGEGSLLQHAAAFLDPFATLLGLDGMILLAFLLGLPANEIVLPLVLMGYLSAGAPVELGSLAEMRAVFVANGWTPVTALCTAVFFLFHWPCSTTLLTVKKETGSWGYTAICAALPTAIGMLLCLLIAAFGRLAY